MFTLNRFIVSIVLGASLFTPHDALASVPLVECDPLPGLIPNVWQGEGVVPGADDRWDNNANWSLGIAPPLTTNPYVCIPAGGTPLIGQAEVAPLVALDVADGGALTVDRGGQLVLLGGLLTPSTISGRLDLLGATLSGPGRVNVSGTLAAHNLGPSDPATITGTTGHMVVGDAGVVDVSGGRVNLGGQYQLSVRGLLRVHDGGFVAADHGTMLELLPHSGTGAGTGTLRLEDDGDYLEGGNPLGIAPLGTVVNRGLIVKSGGTGTSLVTGTYSQPDPGAVTVDSGALLLPSGSATAATVDGGAAYGSGQCLVPAQADCEAQTFGADTQNVQLRVPGADTSGASVTVQELTSTSSAADIGFPVLAHADGLSATPAAPAILSFRYDERLLDGRGWTSVDMFRRADGTSTYVELQPCLADGSPPTGQQACVDRRGLPESSRNVVDAEGPGSAPDVIMVVRTVGTSRWVAR
jgi:hypothetical protein